MALTITHSTPADGTFSATGAAAWNATHTLSVTGTTGEIQYNNAGDLAGMSGTSWNDTTRSLTLTGATVTASAPVFDVSQTWNNAAVTFVGKSFNATDTASAADSVLERWRVNNVSQFEIYKTGSLNFSGSFNLNIGGVPYLRLTTGNLRIVAAANFEWSSTGGATGAGDLFLTRRAAANLRLGAADAASPQPQTLSVQSVSSGTTNTAGANFTITGSQGTGTGAGGSIIFQVAPAGTSGTAQNALVTAWTIASDRSSNFDGWVYLKDNRFFSGSTAGAAGVAIFNQQLNLSTAIRFASGSTYGSTVTELVGEAANTLALRNGTNAQEMRVYKTTTGTVYKALRGDNNLIKIAGESFADGSGANAGTLTNSPVVGNPTKWIPIDDNGTTRYIPAW